MPNLSPWGYETYNRLNPYFHNPNRDFREEFLDATLPDEEREKHLEAIYAMEYIRSIEERSAEGKGVIMHLDIHETTDSDRTRFRHEQASHDGETYTPTEDDVPNGYFILTDNPDIQNEGLSGTFEQAMIGAVKESGTTPIASNIDIPGHGYTPYQGICYSEVHNVASKFTKAAYRVTTEMNPDIDGMTLETANRAQIAGIKGAISWLLGQPPRL